VFIGKVYAEAWSSGNHA